MNDIHINNGYRLRPAAMDEIPVIWEIILQAKAQMYREGKHQWDENYPTVPILEHDVRRGWGYVLVPEKNTSDQNVYDEAAPFFNDHTGTDSGTSRQDIIAYGAVVFDGEPAYSGLWDGQWLSEQPYVVLHRLAVADRWKPAASRSTPTTTTSTCSASSPASASPTAAASATMQGSAWPTKNCL